MEISWNYRGEVKSKEANATAQWLQNNKKVHLWKDDQQVLRFD